MTMAQSGVVVSAAAARSGGGGRHRPGGGVRRTHVRCAAAARLSGDTTTDENDHREEAGECEGDNASSSGGGGVELKGWRSGGAAAACAAVALSASVMIATPGEALAGSYGTGLGYFEALERERAISEEPVPLSTRDGRRSNSPLQREQKQLSRGMPLSLGAGDDGTEEGEYTSLYADNDTSNDSGEADYKRWGKALFQWGVIIAVIANAQRARNRGSAVTKRLGLAGKAGTELIGTRWRLTLDIGREPGTWMPPAWWGSAR